MSATTLTHKEKLAGMRAAAIGNALEWFDWTLYGILSVYLARNLFDNQDPKSAMLLTLAIFAGGFIARPFGGWAFGKLGDRLGRKNTMVTTMVLMAISSVLIGLVPSYESIGAWASTLLLVLRVLQGMAHGGEAGASYTYIAEIAPADKRGLWSSSLFVSVTLGVMLATALAAVLTMIFSEEAMNQYGWRIGFFIGGFLGLYALILRRTAQETDVFHNMEKETQNQDKKSYKLSGKEKLSIALKIVMLSAASNVAYYTWVTFAPSTAIANGMDASGAYKASLLAQVLCLFWLPVCGWISDKIGRKKTVIIYGIGIMLVTIPIAKIVNIEPYTLFIGQVLGLGVWALIAAIYPAVIAEQVPTHARAQGVGFVSSLSVSIFGGTAPYLQAYLANNDLSHFYSIYVMSLGLLAVIAGFIIKETAGKDLNSI